MTRRRAELGTIKTGDLGSLVTHRINENIVEAQRASQIGDQLVIQNNALKDKEDDSIKFYSRTEIEATEVGEGASIEDNAQAEPSYSEAMSATANKYAVYDAVSRESIEDARVDVVDGVTEEMGEALANKKDKIILRRLCNDDNSSENTNLASNVGQLSNAPVIGIHKVEDAANNTALSDYDFSPATGSIQTNDIKADGTIATVYTYATANNVSSGSKDQIAMGDIADAKFKLTGNRFKPDKLVVSPKFISFLEQNSDFINANVYSGDLPQSVEGRLYNMDVLQSDNLPGQLPSTSSSSGGYIAILVDSDKAMPYLPKSDVQVDRKENLDEQVQKLYASERYAVGGDSAGSRLLRSNAVAVLAVDHAF